MQDRETTVLGLLGIGIATCTTYIFNYGVKWGDVPAFPLAQFYDAYPFHTTPPKIVWQLAGVGFLYVWLAWCLSFVIAWGSTHRKIYRQDAGSRKQIFHRVIYCIFLLACLQVLLMFYAHWYPSHYQVKSDETVAQVQEEQEIETIPSFLDWTTLFSDNTESEEQMEEQSNLLRYVVSFFIQFLGMAFTSLYLEIQERTRSLEYLQQYQKDVEEQAGNQALAIVQSFWHWIFKYSMSYLLAFVTVFGWCLSMSIMQFGQYVMAISFFMTAYRQYIACFVKYQDQTWALSYLVLMTLVVLKNVCLSFPAIATATICFVDANVRTFL